MELIMNDKQARSKFQGVSPVDLIFNFNFNQFINILYKEYMKI